MKFNVVVFGHSYVRDLSRQGITEFSMADNSFRLDYVSLPGANFCSFDHTDHFEVVKSKKPDFVVVILGGNDLRVKTDLSKVYADCTRFYNTLRDFLPDSIIIASQIENRFYQDNNRFGCPPGKQFDYLRRHFNRFLKNKKFKDCLLQVQGPNRLDKEENYRDGVHLSSVGLRKYCVFLRETVFSAYHRFRA